MASINNRSDDVAAAAAERAVANAANVAKATEASTGNAGLAEGDAAKRNVQKAPKGL